MQERKLFLAILYNGIITDTLDCLCHKWFCEKVASNTPHETTVFINFSSSKEPQPSYLPPNSRMDCTTSSQRLIKRSASPGAW